MPNACRDTVLPALRSVCTPRSLPQKSRFRLLIASPRPRLNALSPESREIHFAFVASPFFFFLLISFLPLLHPPDFLIFFSCAKLWNFFFFFFFVRERIFWIIRRCSVQICICIVEKEAGKNISRRFTIRLKYLMIRNILAYRVINTWSYVINWNDKNRSSRVFLALPF